MKTRYLILLLCSCLVFAAEDAELEKAKQAVIEFQRNAYLMAKAADAINASHHDGYYSKKTAQLIDAATKPFKEKFKQYISPSFDYIAQCNNDGEDAPCFWLDATRSDATPDSAFKAYKAEWLDKAKTEAAVWVKAGLCAFEQKEPPPNPNFVPGRDYELNLNYDVFHYQLELRRENGQWKIFDAEQVKSFSYNWNAKTKKFVFYEGFKNNKSVYSDIDKTGCY